MRKIVLGIMVVLGSAACGHSGGGAARAEAGQAKAAKRDADNAQAVQKRAAFDLTCPEEQVVVALLDEGTWMKPATFGATGCEKQATYLWRMGTIIRQ